MQLLDHSIHALWVDVADGSGCTIGDVGDAGIRGQSGPPELITHMLVLRNVTHLLDEILCTGVKQIGHINQRIEHGFLEHEPTRRNVDRRLHRHVLHLSHFLIELDHLVVDGVGRFEEVEEAAILHVVLLSRII